MAPPIAPIKPPSSQPFSAPLIVSHTAITTISGYAIFDTTPDTARNKVPKISSLEPMPVKNSIKVPIPFLTKLIAFDIGPLASASAVNPAVIGSKKPVTALFIVDTTLPSKDPSPNRFLKNPTALSNNEANLLTTEENMPLIPSINAVNDS